MPLSKLELQVVHAALARLLPTFAALPPLGADEQLRIYAVQQVVAQEIAAHRPTLYKGHRVLEWRLPRAQAPRLNEYAYLKNWAKKRLRQELDDQLRALLPKFPQALLHGARKQRWARVTRFSTKTVDELSVDVLGGKMPLDALVRVGVLADDSIELLVREAHVMKTKMGNTHVLVEIFEVDNEGVHHDPPKDGQVAQVVRVEGKLTQEIKRCASSLATPRRRTAKRTSRS